MSIESKLYYESGITNHIIKSNIEDLKQKGGLYLMNLKINPTYLIPLQRIKEAQKSRPSLESIAKQNMILGGQGFKIYKKINTVLELSKMAKVSHETYNKGVHILQCTDQKLIEQVLSGNKRIEPAYRQLKSKKRICDFRGQYT